MILPQFAPKSGLEASVRALFSAGEQGAFYDPSDWATLFTDAAGTTPVTAVEQPVSLMLDKSKGGVGTNGAKRVNLLSYTEQFDNAFWSKTRNTVTANDQVAPDGTTTGDKLNCSGTATGGMYIANTANSTTIASNSLLKISCYGKKGSRNQFSLDILDTGAATNYVSVRFNLNDGTYVNYAVGGTWTLVGTPQIESAANGWYKMSYTAQTNGTNLIFVVYPSITSSSDYSCTSGVDYGYVWGADVRLNSEANTLPTYQKITDTWYNTQAGNHAYTPSTATASRPVLSARVNLLTKTEQFDDATSWATAGRATISANTTDTTNPLGGNTAEKITETTDNGTHRVNQSSITPAQNSTYTFSIYIKKGTRNWVWILFQATDSGLHTTNQIQYFNLSTATKGQQITEQSFGSTVMTVFVSSSIQDVGNGWYRVSLIATAQNNPTALAVTIGLASADGTNSYAGTTSDYGYIWGADLRVANDGVGIPSYQRVNTSSDYDVVGFPYYLRFDASDDYMLTNAIDFSGGDAMTVAAALRKNSDAALGVVAELSATIASNNGTFLLSAPNSAAANFNYSSKGTTAVANTVTTYTAPISAVIVADSDISSDSNNIRINGGSATAATSDQGSGNYGNYAMYLGRRGGTSDAFGGRLYGAIVRAGAVNEAQATSLASYLNTKSKIY